MVTEGFGLSSPGRIYMCHCIVRGKLSKTCPMNGWFVCGWQCGHHSHSFTGWIPTETPGGSGASGKEELVWDLESLRAWEGIPWPRTHFKHVPRPREPVDSGFPMWLPAGSASRQRRR